MTTPTAPPPSRSSTPLPRRAGMLAGAILAAALVLSLVGGIVAGPLLRVAGALALGVGLPDEAVLPTLAERSVVYAADGSVLAVLHEEVDRRIVALTEIPEHVRHAVLTAEDRRFYEHDGYDMEGIGRALLANVRAGGITQGGSTITQQLAKENFVGAEQSLDRKMSELLHAVVLEDEFSKDQLLERYLNQVYFGSGAYGIAAAAEEFFGVPPGKLTVDQAALLAGMIRAPGQLNPRTNPEGAEARRNRVLAGMVAEGYLDAPAAAELADRPLEVTAEHEVDVREPYFVEAVKREFFANPTFGKTREERIDALFSGGLKIHTTLDPRLQEIADEVVAAHFPSDDGPTAAIAAVEPGTGRVVALHSGADFSAERFDLATQGRRQPGSAFKPIVLAAALSDGFPLELVLAGDGPLELNLPGHGQPWTVENYDGSRYGTVDLREATVRSVNTAFAELIVLLGPDKAAELGAAMGVDIEAATGGRIVPALALGGFERGVTPLEMASAYATFADEGRHVHPYVIDQVTDHGGQDVFVADATREQVLEPAVNAVMVDVLQDVVRYGTGTGAQLPGWQPAGKTGTAQNSADAWYAGVVPVLSAAVWVGHPEGQVAMPGMAGGGLPATVWREFMSRALAGVEPVAFPEVDQDLSHLVAGHEVRLPDLRGMSRRAALGRLAGLRLVGSVQVVASHAAEGDVAWQSPRPGTSATPGDRVILGVSSGQPPAPPPPPTRPDPGPPPTAEPQPEPEPDPDPEPEAAPAPDPDPDPAPAPVPQPGPMQAPAPGPDPSPRSEGPEEGLPIP